MQNQYHELAQLVTNVLEACRFEAVGYGVYSNPQLNTLKEMLKAEGFTFLGCGYFAMALTHPSIPDTALKFGFKKEDSGAAYAAYCRNKWASYNDESSSVTYEEVRHLPEVKHIARYPRFYMVAMPKYESAEGYANRIRTKFGYGSEAYEIAGDIAYNLERYCCNYTTETLEDIEARIEDLSNLELPEIEMLTEFNNLFCETSLLETGKAIGQFFRGIGSIDIHDENYMFATDRDGFKIIVITDPVSFRHDDLDQRNIEDTLDDDEC